MIPTQTLAFTVGFQELVVVFFLVVAVVVLAIAARLGRRSRP